MKLAPKLVAAIIVVAGIADIAGTEAYARGGGGSNFMNSPGYQRRLQESRGQVTVQSKRTLFRAAVGLSTQELAQARQALISI